MLVPYYNNSTSSKEDFVNNLTDTEREKMREFESLRQNIDIFSVYATRNEPSIVLDDFLFLGNMQHAKDQELLDRYQISKYFLKYFFIFLLFLFS
jgi:hypothetical protein